MSRTNPSFTRAFIVLSICSISKFRFNLILSEQHRCRQRASHRNNKNCKANTAPSRARHRVKGEHVKWHAGSAVSFKTMSRRVLERWENSCFSAIQRRKVFRIFLICITKEQWTVACRWCCYHLDAEIATFSVAIKKWNFRCSRTTCWRLVKLSWPCTTHAYLYGVLMIRSILWRCAKWLASDEFTVKAIKREKFINKIKIHHHVQSRSQMKLEIISTSQLVELDVNSNGSAGDARAITVVNKVIINRIPFLVDCLTSCGLFLSSPSSSSALSSTKQTSTLLQHVFISGTMLIETSSTSRASFTI